MDAANPTPITGLQHFLFAWAKRLNNSFDPAPPPGTPTVGIPNVDTGVVTGSLGFPAGGALSFTATQPSQGTVSVASDGTYIYTPTQAARQAATATTTDTFTATVHEGLSTNSVTVTVPVDPGTPVAGTTTGGAPNPVTGVVTGTVAFTDTAGRTLTYTSLDTSSGGGTVSLNTSTGVYTYTPTQAQRQAATLTTTDSFTVTATNGVRSTTETVTVPVDAGTPVPGTATVSSPDPSTGAVTGSAVFTDPAGRTLTYSSPTTSTGGGTVVLNASTGVFTYTPTTAQRQAATPTTTDTIIVTASNGAHTATQTITVPVVPDTNGLSFTRSVVVSGLANPTDLRFLPDGRLLIAEKSGAILIASSDGQLQSQPLITLNTRSDHDRGLLGVEVDPHFAENGYIYVDYVTADNYERLSRLTVTDPSAAVLTVDPGSEDVLLQASQPAADDHLGGAIRFGPDGKLYWSVGNNDFYSAGDAPAGFTYPSNNAQDLSNIFGKILRLNPDGTVPADNPFVNAPGDDPYIYAYGLRNPFRMTFTPDGNLLVADVGENVWEEVDNVTAGGNYGWPLAEGPCSGIGTTGCSTPSPYQNPVYAYNHTLPGTTTPSSASITGVLAYTGATSLGEDQNIVLISDYSQGWTEELTCNSGYTSCGNPSIVDPGTGAFQGPVELVQGPDGSVYQVGESVGTISRLTPSSA